MAKEKIAKNFRYCHTCGNRVYFNSDGSCPECIAQAQRLSAASNLKNQIVDPSQKTHSTKNSNPSIQEKDPIR